MTNTTSTLKQLIFTLVIFTLLSCENKTKNTVSTTSKFEDTLKVEKSEIKQNSIHKVVIDYKINNDRPNM